MIKPEYPNRRLLFLSKLSITKAAMIPDAKAL
jgi:hypothetical protein